MSSFHTVCGGFDSKNEKNVNMGFALKEIQNIWYQKLKQEGFVDIEDTGCPGGLSNKAFNITNLKAQYSDDSYKSKKTYYHIATHFLESHSFDSPSEYEIWKLHVDGVAMRKISKQVDIKTCQVFLIIKKLRKQLKGEHLILPDIGIRAVKHYGVDHQIDIAIEECSELIQSLCHYKRKRANQDEVSEEIADVYIVLMSLREIFPQGFIDQMLSEKCERLLRRIKNNKDV